MGLLKGESSNSPSTSTSSSSSTGGFNAILDRGSEFEGKLSFEGTVRIDGSFKGEIISDANLVVGESGKVQADISIGSISVSGEVVGNITAKDRIELHAPATIKGNLKTKTLIIEEGVSFEGNCQMEKAGNVKPQKSTFETSTNTDKSAKGETSTSRSGAEARA